MQMLGTTYVSTAQINSLSGRKGESLWIIYKGSWIEMLDRMEEREESWGWWIVVGCYVRSCRKLGMGIWKTGGEERRKEKKKKDSLSLLSRVPFPILILIFTNPHFLTSSFPFF